MLATAACLLAALAAAAANVVVYPQELPHIIMEEFRDMPASFGEDLPPEGLRGFLVGGEPEDGCSALGKPPPVTDNFTGKWIVLIARYNCSFEVKVRNAQLAGYDCAIVHNVNSSDLETMSAKDPAGIVIPSVFVNDVTGRALLDQYLYTNGFYIMVNGDLPFNINTHLLLPFAIVVVLCLLVILVFMIVKCIKDRRRARRHRLPGRALRKIPTCKFSKGDPYDTCAICLDDYQDGDRLRVLPCAHAYHAACIDPWLTQNKRVCPVCKRRVFAAGERRRLHSDSDSHSDTEPLLNDDEAPTQGGTFDEQRENPFVRARRFMARLSTRANQDVAAAEAASPSEDADQTNTNEENGNESDRQPLVQPRVGTLSERRERRGRRARSAGAGGGGGSGGASSRPPRGSRAPAPSPATLLHSDTHSINTEERGEIGVAALPAATSPHHDHVDL